MVFPPSNTKINAKITELTILNYHEINSKLTVELIKKGFKVKPFVSQQQITQKNENLEIKYNQSATRYGIKIDSTNTDFTCIFSSKRVSEFVFTLIDLKTNDIVDIYEKSGPTGKCPPLTPIYTLYANYLVANY